MTLRSSLRWRRSIDDGRSVQRGLRVWLSMPVVVTVDGDRRDGSVRNESIGGASRRAADAPPDAGTTVRSALDIGDHPPAVNAAVAYSQAIGTAKRRAVRESGMGITGLDEARLDCGLLSASASGSFRLGSTRGSGEEPDRCLSWPAARARRRPFVPPSTWPRRRRHGSCVFERLSRWVDRHDPDNHVPGDRRLLGGPPPTRVPASPATP
jgi:hypothetical protein